MKNDESLITDNILTKIDSESDIEFKDISDSLTEDPQKIENLENSLKEPKRNYRQIKQC